MELSDCIVANIATIVDKQEIERLYVKPFLIAIENSNVAAYQEKILSDVAIYLNYVVSTIVTSSYSLDEQSTLLDEAEAKLANVRFKLVDDSMYFIRDNVPLYTAYHPLASFYFAGGENSDITSTNRTCLREIFFEYINPLSTFKTTQRNESSRNKSCLNRFFSRANVSNNELASTGVSITEKTYYTLGSYIQIIDTPCCATSGEYTTKKKIKLSLLAQSTVFSENRTLQLFPSLYHAIEYSIFKTMDLDDGTYVPSIVAVSYRGNALLDEQIIEGHHVVEVEVDTPPPPVENPYPEAMIIGDAPILRHETIIINKRTIWSSNYASLSRQSRVSFFEILPQDVKATGAICLTEDRWDPWKRGRFNEYFSYINLGHILDGETLQEKLNSTRLGCTIC